MKRILLLLLVIVLSIFPSCKSNEIPNQEQLSNQPDSIESNETKGYKYDRITIDGVDISEFSLLESYGTNVKPLQDFFIDVIGVKLNIDTFKKSGVHYIAVEMSPTVINECKIKIEDGDLILFGDWAVYDELLQYFTKRYFDSFDSKEIALTSENNMTLTANELLTAFDQDYIPPLGGGKDETKLITISCFGDSITQGVGLDGNTTAEYGKDPYPAWLTTMLTDAGRNVLVHNYGHSGERITEVAVRSGAFICCTTEDIVLPGDRSFVSLGVRTNGENGRVITSKIAVSDGEFTAVNPSVFFTNMHSDTNPVDLNGIACEIIGGDVTGEIRIRTKYKTDEDILIPKGSILRTAEVVDADINIYFAGINDGKKMSLSDFTNIFSKCGDVNGGDYIVLGYHLPIWRTNWGDVSGGIDQKKDAVYKQACYDAFGYRFIDLYEEFSSRGLDIALECGLFSDKSEEELAVMRQKLEAHIVPGEFTESGNDGDGHLSREGCAVVAWLIIERLEMLSYI